MRGNRLRILEEIAKKPASGYDLTNRIEMVDAAIRKALKAFLANDLITPTEKKGHGRRERTEYAVTEDGARALRILKAEKDPADDPLERLRWERHLQDVLGASLYERCVNADLIDTKSQVVSLPSRIGQAVSWNSGDFFDQS